ncbi:MAG: C40 family peptidase [Spirochaetaceae bacterium]|nr:C40 family peptidase [Spirochaetaceae bacterium]
MADPRRRAEGRRGRGLAILKRTAALAALFLSAAATAGSVSAPLAASSSALVEREGRLVAEALRWLGTPYAYGGQSRKGVDCSGFVGAVLEAAGLLAEAPRRSEAFALLGEEAPGPRRPGDLLLFKRGGRIDHVGIALSSSYFIHAASRGPRRGVIVSSVEEAYWKRGFAGARRLKSKGEL